MEEVQPPISRNSQVSRLSREAEIEKFLRLVMVPKIAAGIGSGNQSDDEMAFMSYYTLLKYETDDNLLH